MAHVLIVGKPTDSRRDFTRSAPVGTETLDASVPAGSVGLCIRDDVRLDSIEIDTLAKELAETLRDLNYATS